MRYVILGGGTGPSEVLRGLKSVCEKHDSITAIVTTADNGGSSQRIRMERNTPAFGDIRHAMEALIPDTFWKEIFSYRFPEREMQTKKEIEGHVVGNFIITCLYEHNPEGFTASLLELQKKLGIDSRFRVLPVTSDQVDIAAEFANGEIVKGESQITLANLQNPQCYPLPIQKITIDPEFTTLDEKSAIALLEADMIILGPGSTYTSILAVLAIPEVRECLREVRGKKVIITNIMTQPGETSGFAKNGGKITFRSSDFVRVIEEFSGITADFIIVNTEKPAEPTLEIYERYEQQFVENDIDALEYLLRGQEVICADLAFVSDKHIRHHRTRLGNVITSIAKRLK